MTLTIQVNLLKSYLPITINLYRNRKIKIKKIVLMKLHIKENDCSGIIGRGGRTLSVLFMILVNKYSFWKYFHIFVNSNWDSIFPILFYKCVRNSAIDNNNVRQNEDCNNKFVLINYILWKLSNNSANHCN